MKTISFLRHAKSDWDTPFLNDHARGLSSRGLKNCKSLEKLLGKRDFLADIAYVSDSRRTMDTYTNLTKEKKICKELVVTHALYEAEPRAYLESISHTSNSHKSILFIGHNPGMEIVINTLLKVHLGTYSIFTKYPTLGFCTLQFSTDDWNDIPSTRGSLSFFWTPEKGGD